MAGNSSIEGSQTVTFTDNLSFDGTDRGGAMVANGQLWIGATASNRANDGGHVRLGSITSTDGSVTVTNGPGTIGLSVAGQIFAPNAVLQEFDDFISGWPSKMPWDVIPGSTGQPYYGNGQSGHPGTLFTIGGFSANAGIYLDQLTNLGTHTVNPFFVGGGILTNNWVISLSNLSSAFNHYRFTCGMADNTSLSTPTDSFVSGVYFSYSDDTNSGNWVLNCTDSGVTTSVNTSIPVVGSGIYNTLTTVANAAGTSVDFYINNALAGTISTNIPTSQISPFFMAINTAGSIPTFVCDLWWVTYELSDPRPGPILPVTSNGVLIRKYVATATDLDMLTGDSIVGVTSTSSPRTINLPFISVSAGTEYTIKDESGAASVNNITVSGNGANIDGASTFVINTNYGAIDVYYNGTNYFVI